MTKKTKGKTCLKKDCWSLKEKQNQKPKSDVQVEAAMGETVVTFRDAFPYI